MGILASSNLSESGTPILPVEQPFSLSKRQFAESLLSRAAFISLLVFTFLLYARPNDFRPDIFGTFPFAKISALAALLAYLMLKLIRREWPAIWTIEVKMTLVIALLGFAHIPVALHPEDSRDVLFSLFLKVACIFALLINVLDTRQRLRTLLYLMVACGAVLALDTTRKYLSGNFVTNWRRVAAHVGFLGDQNDLATFFAVLLPLAIALALTQKGALRGTLLGSAVILTVGIVLTFSRTGFLGLVAGSIFLLWKLRHTHRKLTRIVAGMIVLAFLLAIPTSYGRRIYTILNPSKDATLSAQERQKLLIHGVGVASEHLLVGVGMGNYLYYSGGNYIHYAGRDRKAHNSYLEILVELGLTGLIAYLILLIVPLRRLQQVEAKLSKGRDPAALMAPDKSEFHYLSIGFQGSILAYLVCSFFLSIQYNWHGYYPIAGAIVLHSLHRTTILAAKKNPGRNKTKTRHRGRRRHRHHGSRMTSNFRLRAEG